MGWSVVDLLVAHSGRHAEGGDDSFSAKAMSFLSAKLLGLVGTLQPTKHLCVDTTGAVVAGEYWDDLVVPATLVNLSGPPSPPAYNDVDQTVDFAAAGTNTIQVNYQMPHRWKEGTEVRFHIHMMPSNTNTGNIVWEHKLRWVSNNGAAAGSWTTTTQTEAAGGVTDVLCLCAVKAIAGTSRKISAILQIQLQRLGGDGADTFTGLAKVMSLDLHYQADAPGSVAEGTK